MGKDVALALPESADTLPKWAPYPTHQDQWLPLWFVQLYHTQDTSTAGKEYRQELNNRVNSNDRELMTQGLVGGAQKFWEQHKQEERTDHVRNTNT